MSYSGPSSKPNHVAKSAILQRLRKSAKLNQGELAKQLKIGKTTVSAIENCKENTMSSLQQDLLENWWNICYPLADADTKKEAKTIIIKLYDFD